MYTPYVTPEEYTAFGYNTIPENELNKFLVKASRAVDDMTFNRIVDKGFDRLTDFQKDIIQTVVCSHAEFLFENNDIINSVLDSYSINGVSMKFGSGAGVIYAGSLPIERDTYALLKQTGLTCRLIG